MKKIAIIGLLSILFVGCASSHVEIYKGSEKVFEGEGKVIPDFESNTFNITVKEDTGDVITFFGNDLHGFFAK